MVDDAVENGLCPWLLQHHWCHSLLKGLEVEAILLAIYPAFGELFSEKFLGNTVS